MMTILSVLVFILVQGCAVCDELYPISVLRDITKSQLEESPDNHHDIGPLQEKSYVPNDPNIIWFGKNIVKKYGFVKHSSEDKWMTQPTFAGLLGTKEFKTAADKAKNFFKTYRNWEVTKETFSRMRGTKKICTDLLYITAARYLLVTYILYEQSGFKIIPCARTVDNKKIVIPDSGVCYPAPYGSATCTSDYDVGLVGKDAGFLTEKFNNYFQDVKNFEKPSELVFDTNVYAFTLEFAMPFYFDKLPPYFDDEVAKKEQTVNSKMQELASAYYKVFKYNESFFNTLKAGAVGAMDVKKAARSMTALNSWLGTFSTMKMRIIDFQNSAERLRLAHNTKYQELVKKMSQDGGYKPESMGTLAKALIYAAEAYHTRGAIRHIVGGTQMKVIELSPRTPLSVNDLWVSMIENWGESNKEYNHCKNDSLVRCFLKMSKYMWRVFNAMRLVRARLPNAYKLRGVVRFGEQFGDPEYAMAMWLRYKKQGDEAIPEEDIKAVKSFLLQFECNQAVLNMRQPIPPDCVTKMNDKINDYNKALASLVTDATIWKGR